MIYVPPHEIKDTWPMVRKGLERIIEKISPDWIPEDVYMALMCGSSTLHLCYTEDEYDGFLVLTPVKDYGQSVLFIWCAYGKAKNHMDEIKEIARQIGAKKIRFASPRKGLSKRYRPITTIYEEEV